MRCSDLAKLVAVAALAGCTSQAAPQFDGSYRLTAIDGKPIPGAASLQIAGNALSGQGPCNLYRGRNLSDWPAVDISAIASTRRYCVQEGGEALFLKAMGQIDTARLSGDGLTLSGPDHVLHFTAG